MSFSLYFLASVPEEEKTPEPGTVEAHQYLWSFPGTTLELTHNYGSETKEGPIYHPGNKPQEGDRRGKFRLFFGVPSWPKVCIEKCHFIILNHILLTLCHHNTS